MPVPTAQKALIPTDLHSFRGVNLRQDRLDLADDDLARVINADLHTLPGVVQARLGRSTQFSTALADTVIRRLAKHNARRYQVAGQAVYRNQVSILTGLSSNLVTTLLAVQPLNDTATWTFIADDALMRKDDGTNVRNWGIAGPAAAAAITVGAGTGLTGDYTAVYTYARVVGGTVIHESNPSATPAAVTLANENLNVPVVASTDAQVTNIRLYRSVAGGAAHLFDVQLTNTSGTPVSFQADTALGTAVDTDNDAPNTMSSIALHLGHVFGCRDASNPHYLWWAKRFRPEAIPSSNFIAIGSPGDPLQAVVSLTGVLGVFSRETKYRILGNATQGFAELEALSHRGTPAWQAVLVTASGAVFPARDGLWVTNFMDADVELSQAIEPMFHGQTIHGTAPIDWAQADEMSTAAYKGRLYFGYTDTTGARMLAVFSSDTGRWYFYDHPAKSLLVEEDVDQLTAGFADGLVYILEDATATGDAGNPISMEVQLPTRGSPWLRQRFDYLRPDVDPKNGTITAEVYVDDVLVHTLSITGTRTQARRLRRLPGTMGYTWRVRYTYTGTERAAKYGARMLSLPLEVA